MKQRLFSSSLAVIAAASIAMPFAALAQQNPYEVAGEKVGQVGTQAGINSGANEDALINMIGNIINVILGFLGILLLIYILYAGFLWMTAGGEKGNVEKATTMIKNAIIGLIIIVAAYAISTFVLSKLVEATTGA